MKASFGETIWKTVSWFLTTTLWLFLILDLAVFILIFYQEGFDWNQIFAIFIIGISIFSLTSVITHLPLWIQWVCFPSFLLLYYKYGFQFLYSLPVGINYDFIWALPKTISRLVGFPVEGNVIGFIFWSGFIFTFLAFVLQLEHWTLGFLAARKVGFAQEIWEEKKTKLIEEKRKYFETQTKVAPLSKKSRFKKGVFYLFLIFFISGLIFLAVFLYAKWENQKYPVLWRTTVTGTAVCYWEKCGKKGTLLPDRIEPGRPRIANFVLDKENKQLILEVIISIQPVVKPEISLEIELQNPGKNKIFYISKEEVFKGTTSDSPNENSIISKKFDFTADRAGEYTLTVTPYNYGVAYVDVSVRDIIR